MCLDLAIALERLQMNTVLQKHSLAGSYGTFISIYLGQIPVQALQINTSQTYDIESMLRVLMKCKNDISEMVV